MMTIVAQVSTAIALRVGGTDQTCVAVESDVPPVVGIGWDVGGTEEPHAALGVDLGYDGCILVENGD